MEWEIKGLTDVVRCGAGGTNRLPFRRPFPFPSPYGFGSGICTVPARSEFCFASGMLNNFHAFQLAKKIYWGCKQVRVPTLLRDQLLRASSSVALNIAEGSGKRTPQDQRRFYSTALGSLRECEAVLALEEIKNPELLGSIDRLGAILYTLTTDRRLRNRSGTETETATEAGTAADHSPVPF